MTLAACAARSPLALSKPTAAAVVLFDDDSLHLLLFDVKSAVPMLRGTKSEPFSLPSLFEVKPESRSVDDILREFRHVAQRFGAVDLQYLVTDAFLSQQDSAKAIDRLKEEGCLPLTKMTKEQEHRDWAFGIKALHRLDSFCLVEVTQRTTHLTVIRGGELPAFFSLPVGSLTAYLDHVQNVVPDLTETRTLLESLAYEIAKTDIPAVPGLPMFGVGRGVQDVVKTLRRVGELPNGSSEISRFALKTLLKPTETARRVMQLRLLHELPKRVHLFYPKTAILFTLLSLLDCHALIYADAGLAEGHLLARRFGFVAETADFTVSLPSPYLP
jgi:exopolyphosphatase/pppGpp-phosphohydrolase